MPITSFVPLATVAVPTEKQSEYPETLTIVPLLNAELLLKTILTLLSQFTEL